jgi:hypothetical protein
MPQAPQTPSSQQRASDLLDDTLDLIHQGVLQGGFDCTFNLRLDRSSLDTHQACFAIKVEHPI